MTDLGQIKLGDSYMFKDKEYIVAEMSYDTSDGEIWIKFYPKPEVIE